MSHDDDLARAVALANEAHAARTRAIQRDEYAQFMLGPKGRHFDGEEWDRRADDLFERMTGRPYS